MRYGTATSIVFAMKCSLFQLIDINEETFCQQLGLDVAFSFNITVAVRNVTAMSSQEFPREKMTWLMYNQRKTSF